jgi:hypothetical protein
MTKPIDQYPYHVRERAAIYEYEANMTREDAENKAIKEYEKERSHGD